MLKRSALAALRLVGSALRTILVGVLAVSLIAGGIAFADYTATQGSGTTFASLVLATKHYMAMVLCDATAGESQCMGVDSNGNAKVIAQGVAAGTASSGISGSAIMCNPVNALPSYTNGLENFVNCDLNGRQIYVPYSNKENVLNCAVTLTTTGATTCTGMGAQGVSVKIYITDGYCTRNDAGTTAISVTSDAQDSSATNNIIFDLPNNGGGGGFAKAPGGTPWVVAANTAFTLNISTNTTSVHCNFNGFKGL